MEHVRKSKEVTIICCLLSIIVNYLMITTLFWKLNNEYPNAKIFYFLHFFNEMLITEKITL